METINFMYFLNNYNSKQLESMFQSLTMPEHFKSKFRGFCDKEETGTRALYSLFFELDSTNQKRFVDYVTTNYKNNI